MTGNSLDMARDCMGGNSTQCAVHGSVMVSYGAGFVLYRVLNAAMGAPPCQVPLGSGSGPSV